MPHKFSLRIIALLLCGVSPVSAQRQSGPPAAWTCAEVTIAKLDGDTTGSARAEQSVAERMRLQLKQLGLLCPVVAVASQSYIVTGTEEYKDYWQRFRQSPAALQFTYRLRVVAWAREGGLVDLILLSRTITTMKLASGTLQKSEGEADVSKWVRNTRSVDMASFASESVDMIVQLNGART